MANTTVRGAQNIHGANPQSLVEQVIRLRIYESTYWKEQCFALTAESLIDNAIKLKAIGGVYSNQRPTDFICLLLKLLQIQPEKEILVEYLLVEEFKYLRALAAMYIRMTFRAVEVYELLEPLLKDYRKLRLLSMSGYDLTYMDEFVDQLLTEDRVCDIILPRLQKREILEETEGLQPRRSPLLDIFEEKSGDSGSEASSTGAPKRKRSPSEHRRSRSRSRSRSISAGHRSRTLSDGSAADRDAGEGGRYISRSPSRSRSRSRMPVYRSRTPSKSPDRMEME